MSRGGFLESIPNVEPNKGNGGGADYEMGLDDLWRQDNNIQSVCMIDNNRITRNEDPFKVSFDFGNESLMFGRKASAIPQNSPE